MKLSVGMAISPVHSFKDYSSLKQASVGRIARTNVSEAMFWLGDTMSSSCLDPKKNS